MKSLLLSFLFFLTAVAVAQTDQRYVNRYDIPVSSGSDKIVVIPMEYARWEPLAVEGDTTGIYNAGEMIVDVVCTDYPAGLSLQELLRQRLNAFRKLFPYLRNDQVTAINYVRQRDGSEKEPAKLLFHGVVARFRQAQNPETMKHDVNELERILGITGNGPQDSLVSVPADTVSSTSVHVYTPLKTSTRDSADFLLLTPREALKKGYIDKETYKIFRKFKLLHIRREEKLTSAEKIIFNREVDTTVNYYFPDSTVLKVLNRNNWRGPNVVVDVTGSMYPYTGQLLLWLRKHNLDSFSRNFIFFNDGDLKKDHEKVIGSTGGIYAEQCSTFVDVQNVIMKAMRNGGGGDLPENNVEALLFAEKNFPEAPFHLMIADNWAEIKDTALISRLKKPVRVVLCGSTGVYLNTDYFNLARKTNGSLHLNEQDFYNLATLREGEIITIGGLKYRVSNGNVIPVYEYQQ